ncbi:TPA: hypothetical protein DEO28_02095 [Candidatus Dependentiae bacterium]|nr:MAG: hypothetical protein UR14_C0004G0101 [candidate division TM6 bacterium GW2011_GWE2_31_21]KKP53021.1 MAG: hypothetical protein UR43_C0008G0103 [candidate division TM6 bacterium GW2011_GWF2_33_332]HBS47742.1 hypothetical protein [Candidatus Dependentiae bacterium]HBZ73282.1 hypothetical protein [Candidatus Dependentiae bacterium]
MLVAQSAEESIIKMTDEEKELLAEGVKLFNLGKYLKAFEIFYPLAKEKENFLAIYYLGMLTVKEFKAPFTNPIPDEMYI